VGHHRSSVPRVRRLRLRAGPPGTGVALPGLRFTRTADRSGKRPLRFSSPVPSFVLAPSDHPPFSASGGCRARVLCGPRDPDVQTSTPTPCSTMTSTPVDSHDRRTFPCCRVVGWPQWAPDLESWNIDQPASGERSPRDSRKRHRNNPNPELGNSVPGTFRHLYWY
jgi:hypothetical protein